MVWGRKYLGKLDMSDVGQRGGYLKKGGAVTPYKLRTFPSYCRRREGGGRIKCTREKTTKTF